MQLFSHTVFFSSFAYIQTWSTIFAVGLINLRLVDFFICVGDRFFFCFFFGGGVQICTPYFLVFTNE